jgi:hypothetical protein
MATETLVWRGRFAGYAAVVFVIVNLALTDMFSFSITFTFWQVPPLARCRANKKHLEPFKLFQLETT